MDLTNNIEWKDGISGNTPLMAENLNRINKGTKTALEELESETQAKVTAVQDSVTALKSGLENGSVIVSKSNNDGKGNNIEDTYAKQNGSYGDLTAGKALKDGAGNTIKDYYQSKLTFDSVPLEGSTNPVTSEGIKNYVDPNREICKAGDMTVQGDGSTNRIENQFIIKTNVYFGGVPHEKIQYYGSITTNSSTLTLTCPDGLGPTFVNFLTSRLFYFEDTYYDVVKISFSGNEVTFKISTLQYPEGTIVPEVGGNFHFTITTIK